MSNTKDTHFRLRGRSLIWKKPDQPGATEFDARPVERLHAGVDDYLIKRFDKNELLARIQFGLRIL
jgi:CheY-like chemotaxis protein